MNLKFNAQIDALLKRKISHADFTILKKEIKEMDDEAFRPYFQEMWETVDLSEKMPVEQKLRVLRNIQTHSLRRNRVHKWIRIAAVFLLPVLFSAVTYFLVSDHSFSKDELMVIASKGEKSQIVLPDGTKVWLNSESSLSYPVSFSKGSRRVKLNGEGYFEVVKAEKKSFIVQVNGFDIKVLGTKFNVVSREGEPYVDVALVEGRVSVNDGQKELAILRKNQLMHIDRASSKYSITDVYADLTPLWRYDKCHFDNELAQDVFKKLEYWYGMKIYIENSASDYRYSFTVKNETVRELLDLMSHLTPLEYVINGEEVRVRYQ